MLKQKYLNYIILSDGSSIKKKYLKNTKITELLKDNYTKNYILSLKNVNKIDFSKETTVYSFFKKYKN